MQETEENKDHEPLQRINATYIWNEISSVLNFEKGLFYTIKELIIRPGETVRTFIQRDRNRLVKPILFIIICSFIYSIVQQVFQFKDGYVGYSFSDDSALNIILNWVSKNYGYTNIIMGIFIAFWIKVFFKRYAYNFFEILILLCFLMGVGMLLFALFGIADSLIEVKIIDKGYLIGILYILWAIVQFFDKKKLMNYPKAILSYFLGMITFMVSLFILSAVLNLMQ